MILFDNRGHMVSTESAEELHHFAARLGLDLRLFHVNGRGEYHAHYDLVLTAMKERAMAIGAFRVRSRELVERAWWRKTKDSVR
jgi:hypothetical protein